MKHLLIVFLIVINIDTTQGQIVLSGAKWPWEDKWRDPTRGSILLSRVGETDIATLTYHDTKIFMVGRFDSAYKVTWNHNIPAPEHAISAHIMASATTVSALILTHHDDSLGVYGVSIDASTGTIKKKGIVHAVASNALRRPFFVTSPDGTRCALVERNEGDPSTVMIFDGDLNVVASHNTIDIPEYSTNLMLRPLTMWSGDSFYLATASIDDSIDVSIVRVDRDQVTYSQRGLPFTSKDELDVDDSRIEFIAGNGDTFYAIVQERDGSVTNVLVRHQLSVSSASTSAQRYHISERVHPVDAFTRTLIYGDTAFVALERFSALYKRQIASNEMLSIYTVGDGSITRFDPAGARWSKPIPRTTDRTTAGTSETMLFGLTPAVMAAGNGTLTNVLYCEDADDFIVAQDFDAATGEIKQRIPLIDIDGPTYCFLEQWIILPEHRMIWAPVGTAIKVFRY